MIVELVGLPGSGKSTFARTREQEGKWVRARINGRLELLWHAKLFCLRHPISAFLQLCWLIKYRGHRALWYTKFVNLFLVHNAKYMKAVRMPYAIIDQGHLQNAMSLFDTAVSPETITQYLAILPHPDVSIFFDVTKDERMRRQKERGYEVRENVPLDLRREWQDASEKHFATLLGEHQHLSWTSILLAEGREDVVAAELRNLRLWRFVMHLRMPTEKAHGLQIAKTLEALTKVGEHVELWVPRRTNPIHEDVFHYYSLTERFPVRMLASCEALRLVGALGSLAYWLDALAFLTTLLLERIDTEVAYYTRSAPVAWLLKQKGAQVYYEAHLWPSSKQGGFQFLLRGVDGVVANSDGTAEEFRKRGFQNVTVVRNGADLEKFSLNSTHNEARQKARLPLAGNVVMYVGSFARWKGVATLYSAWVKIQKQFPDTTLALVGGEVGTLLQFAECKNIASDTSVTVLPHQASSLVPAYLRSANILVLPNEPVNEESIRYTSPIKLFEYMASGRPIVASDLPSMREVLDDTTATLFAAGDSDDLAKKISFALTHARECEAKAKKASEVAKTYSWENRAKRLNEVVK
jgi:glycosyltransferase involved in cell wall biosynthesis